jgi:hypothetical protein
MGDWLCILRGLRARFVGALSRVGDHSDAFLSPGHSALIRSVFLPGYRDWRMFFYHNLCFLLRAIHDLFQQLRVFFAEQPPLLEAKLRVLLLRPHHGVRFFLGNEDGSDRVFGVQGVGGVGKERGLLFVAGGGFAKGEEVVGCRPLRHFGKG